MNIRKIKLIAYIYIHFSSTLDENNQGDHIYKQIENLHTACPQTAKYGIDDVRTFATSNHIGESHVFLRRQA